MVGGLKCQCNIVVFTVHVSSIAQPAGSLMDSTTTNINTTMMGAMEVATTSTVVRGDISAAMEAREGHREEEEEVVGVRSQLVCGLNRAPFQSFCKPLQAIRAMDQSRAIINTGVQPITHTADDSLHCLVP